MRRYLVALVAIALLAGSFFRSAQQSGSKEMNMLGVISIFMLGMLGTMAIGRYQRRTGLRDTEAALTALGPDCVITDWYARGGGRPDFLVVGPGGLAVVCVDELPGNWSSRRAEVGVAKARDRVQTAACWLRSRLQEAAPAVRGSLGDTAHSLPVRPILVLTRRRAVADYSTEDVSVLNAGQLTTYIRVPGERTILAESDRIQLTRLLRRLGA